jgi:hypothetical protein
VTTIAVGFWKWPDAPHYHHHLRLLAYPDQYAASQLSKFSDADVKSIMHDNLAGFLGVA